MHEVGAGRGLGHPENELWQLAQVTVSQLGFQFSPSTASRIQGVVIEGVQGLRSKGLIDDASKLAETQTNLEKLVREMAREATKNIDKRTAEALRQGEFLSDTELHTLRDSNLEAALAKLCPGLWPFC